ncbi:MAG: class I SAM-dependent methyltransferase [Clostridia bacterium]
MHWEKIEGSFTFQPFYERMVMRFNNATFVELGAWQGQSIMYLAERVKELNKKIKLYTVDIFTVALQQVDQTRILGDDFYNAYLKNIEPLKEYINTIRMRTDEAYKLFEDESIDFLFIDADHSFEAVKKDLKLWYPKVKTGGIIAGHDYMWVDGRVAMAVNQFFLFTGILPEAGDSWMKVKV